MNREEIMEILPHRDSMLLLDEAWKGEDAARAARISSTQSMTGHMLGAAGAMECIVCALTLEKGIIFPTIHLDDPDPECDLNCVPNHAVETQAEAALSTSLGFGGHNAVIALKKV